MYLQPSHYSFSTLFSVAVHRHIDVGPGIISHNLIKTQSEVKSTQHYTFHLCWYMITSKYHIFIQDTCKRHGKYTLKPKECNKINLFRNNIEHYITILIPCRKKHTNNLLYILYRVSTMNREKVMVTSPVLKLMV